jgi:uncharacterized protein with PIN domain
LHDGDRVAIYPVFEAFDIAGVTRVRPRPLRVTRFVLDIHLGKLARLLRLLGFDARYTNDADDAALAAISRDEHRILLTRDRGLLKRRAVSHGYLVRSDNPRTQVREVVGRFHVAGQARPFTRCLRCNGLLEDVPRAAVLDQLEPLTRQHYDEFQRCRECGHVYWRGSHHARLERIAADALAGG